MTRGLIIIAIIGFLSSCSTGTDKTTIDIMNDSIRTFILKQADDPKSYEPVETIMWDTVTFLDNIEKQIKFYDRAAKSFDDSDEYGKKFKADYLADLKRFSQMKDSLLNSSDPESTAAFIVVHKCRLKNKFGALVLSPVVFEFRPDLTIYHVYDQTTGKSKGYPGGFPDSDGRKHDR
jgi:hypothetical protein